MSQRLKNGNKTEQEIVFEMQIADTSLKTKKLKEGNRFESPMLKGTHGRIHKDTEQNTIKHREIL